MHLKLAYLSYDDLLYFLKVGQGVDNAVFTSEVDLSDFAEAPSIHQSKVQYPTAKKKIFYWNLKFADGKFAKLK